MACPSVWYLTSWPLNSEPLPRNTELSRLDTSVVRKLVVGSELSL